MPAPQPVSPELLGALIASLPPSRSLHAPTSPLYAFLKLAAHREVEALFREDATVAHPFPPFGNLAFPYFKMGTIDSLDLFGLAWTPVKRWGQDIGPLKTPLSGEG